MGKRVMSEQKKGKAWIVILVAAIVLIAAGAMLLRLNRDHPADVEGMWRYDSTTSYVFDGVGGGYVATGNGEYRFTYHLRRDNLSLQFVDAAVEDATYTCVIESNKLTLVGGKGTAGGLYELYRG